MIYLQRLFHIERKDLPEFIKISVEQVWPDNQKRGGWPVGLWQIILGAPERILLLTHFNNLAHWEQGRYRQDNVTRTGGPETSDRSNLTREFEATVLQPLSKRQPHDQAPESEWGIYSMRSFKVLDDDINRFVGLMENNVWPWYEQGLGIRPIGLWLSIIATDIRVYQMIRYASLQEWEAIRLAGREPEDNSLKHVRQTSREAQKELKQITRDTNVKILRPITERRP